LLYIRQLHVDYFERVRAIVAESKDVDRVVLTNQQLVDLTETGSGRRSG